MAAAIRLSQQHSCSFDHLVRERQQIIGDANPKRFCRLHVDDQLKLGHLIVFVPA
jgi:hypothetical protein